MSWDIFSKSKIQYFLEKLKGKFVQKETGKGLSSNDYTTTDKNKVALIDNTTTSVSGNPISITGLKSSQLAVNPVITFEPIQDLHGQSKPYPAGGGKNKLPMTVDGIKAKNTQGQWTGNNYLYRGVTFTILTDNANNVTGFKVNGSVNTGDTYALFFMDDFVDYGNVEYKMIASITNGGLRFNVAPYTVKSGTPKITFNGSNVISTADIRLYAGYTATNEVIYPMVLLSSDTDETFTPYSNYAPISGYDKIEVLSCGKNLFDGTYSESGKYLLANGSTSTNYGTDYRITKYIPVKPNTSYALQGLAGSNPAVCWYDSNYNYISGQSYASNSSIIISLPPNAKFIKASWLIGNINSFQIEESASATTYEPYHKTTDLSESLGQTVYGLTHEVRTGKARVTYKAVDLGNLDYSYRGDIVTGVFSNSVINDYVLSLTVKALCEKYNFFGTVPAVQSMADVPDKSFALYYQTGQTATALYIKDTSYNNATTFKASLSGVKLVYELATPFTIQLTPHEIALSQGYNYISTNGTNISLAYHNGELASLADVSQLNETVELLNRPPVRKDSINIKDYTTENNAFTCPCDGYIFVRLPSGSGHVLMRLMDSLGNVVGTYTDAADAEEAKAYSVFVKRGIKTYAYCYVGETLAYTYWFYGIT